MSKKKKNKVKFGLQNVYYAVITEWIEQDDTKIAPIYANPVRLPGAVNLSIDASGEPENFYADDCVYYVISNNSGYEGDLEIALVTTDFAIDVLGERLDSKGVLVESNDAETAQFALLFEFLGDVNHIRHVLYCCSASRPATESSTTEDSTEVKTETLSLTASALPSGVVKAKTCESTDETVYNNWFKQPYSPSDSNYSETES
jgi:phi13 family phage major tail protein